MTANINGNRFYGYRDAAWHNLGVVSQEKMNAVEALTAIGGGYWFRKEPIYYKELNGNLVSNGDYALVRSPAPDDPTEVSFGYVTDKYVPLQPLEACELFDKKVGLNVETLGFLGRGEKMFLTWEMQGFNVKKDDGVRVFGFVALGFNGKDGASLYVVTVRVVCENTWRAAVYQAENLDADNRGVIFSGKHTSPTLARDLGIWMSHVQNKADVQSGKIQNLFANMADKSIPHKDTAFDLLEQIYPTRKGNLMDLPSELRDEEAQRIADSMDNAERDIFAVYDIYNGKGTAIDATAWGLFNSVTEYENYFRTVRKSPAASIMFGNRNKVMNRAARVIAECCDVETEVA